MRLSADSTIGFGSSWASSGCESVSSDPDPRRSRTSLTLSFNCERHAGNWITPGSFSDEAGTAAGCAGADFVIAAGNTCCFGSKEADGGRFGVTGNGSAGNRLISGLGAMAGDGELARLLEIPVAEDDCAPEL